VPDGRVSRETRPLLLAFFVRLLIRLNKPWT